MPYAWATYADGALAGAANVLLDDRLLKDVAALGRDNGRLDMDPAGAAHPARRSALPEA